MSLYFMLLKYQIISLRFKTIPIFSTGLHPALVGNIFNNKTDTRPHKTEVFRIWLKLLPSKALSITTKK
jgi:hypothetical protein